MVTFVMMDVLIEKLRSLPDSKLFEAIASRNLLNSLNYNLSINPTPEREYSPEHFIVEIITDALSGAIADGLNRLDVITFYYVMVEALDCCG